MSEEGKEEGQQQQQTTQVTGDMLEQLLTAASEKAAKKQADEALRKGFVSHEDINVALSELSSNLETTVVSKINESLAPLVEQAVKNAITIDEKTGTMRKGTLLGGVSLDDREADPVAYLIKKGKEQGPDAYDETDKRIIWAVTHKALSMGMVMDQAEEE
jgi:hypothetical protein